MTALRRAVARLLFAAIVLTGAAFVTTMAGVDLGFIGESVSDLADRVAG